MKVIFMGTPDFAVPTLKALIDNGHHIQGVFTQPDRAKNRGMKIEFCPVKNVALEYGLKIYQPEKINEQQYIDIIEELNPEVIVVVAYGQILKPKILSIPRFGCINVHASLLPKYRGAAPINWSIINGEEITGVTTMYMAKGLDSGDIILKKDTPIYKEETAGQLHDRLCILGAELLIDTLKDIEGGNTNRIPQDHSQATYAPMMSKELGRINWNDNANTIYNVIRGTNPWPGAFTYYNGKMIKLWKAELVNKVENTNPGRIIDTDNFGIYVSTGNGVIKIQELQAENSKRMDTATYLRGNNISIGSNFDSNRVEK